MHSTSILMLAGLLASGTTACTHAASTDAAPRSTGSEATAVEAVRPPLVASEPRRHVITTLVTRDTRVSLLAGGELRVALRRPDGTLIADGLSLDELRDRDPVLHAVLTSAVASGEGRRPYLDATLDRSALPDTARTR